MFNPISTNEPELIHSILKDSIRAAKEYSKQSAFSGQIELPYSNDLNIQNLFSLIDQIEEIVLNLYNLPITQFVNGIHSLSSKVDYSILKKTKIHIQNIVDSFNRSIDSIIENPLKLDNATLTNLHKKLQDLIKARQLLNEYFYHEDGSLKFSGLSFRYNKNAQERQRALDKINEVAIVNDNNLQLITDRLQSLITNLFR